MTGFGRNLRTSTRLIRRRPPIDAARYIAP